MGNNESKDIPEQPQTKECEGCKHHVTANKVLEGGKLEGVNTLGMNEDEIAELNDYHYWMSKSREEHERNPCEDYKREKEAEFLTK